MTLDQSALQRIIENLIDGLINDEAHHKTWYLEEALKALGINLETLASDLKEAGYTWEPGIPP